MNHSPEPWRDEDGFICDSAGFALGQLGGVSKADRARIVACVNACAGIPDEDLEAVVGIGKDAAVAHHDKNGVRFIYAPGV